MVVASIKIHKIYIFTPQKIFMLKSLSLWNIYFFKFAFEGKELKNLKEWNKQVQGGGDICII